MARHGLIFSEDGATASSLTDILKLLHSPSSPSPSSSFSSWSIHSPSPSPLSSSSFSSWSPSSLSLSQLCLQGIGFFKTAFQNQSFFFFPIIFFVFRKARIGLREVKLPRVQKTCLGSSAGPPGRIFISQHLLQCVMRHFQVKLVWSRT